MKNKFNRKIKATGEAKAIQLSSRVFQILKNFPGFSKAVSAAPAFPPQAFHSHSTPIAQFTCPAKQPPAPLDNNTLSATGQRV